MSGSRLLLAAALLATGALVAVASDAAAAALVCSALGIFAGLALHQPAEPAPPPPPAAEPPPALDPARLIEAIDDPVLLIERRTVTAANSAARALLGAHIIGEDARVAMRHPDAAPRLAGPLRGRERGIALDGLGGRESRWELAVAPIGEDRRLVHLVDRSAAHAAETMRVDFVANASHELRTPLATLLGFIETLADPKGPDDAATRARFLAIMQGEAQRMRQLIDDLISLSRIEAERHRAPDAAVPLGPLAITVADAMRVAAGEKPGTFDIAAADVRPVAGDEAQLSQLLHNLLGNALKYRRPGTVVHVTVAPLGDDMVRLGVSDEGDGIAPEHLPRLTERFYRVDAGRSRSVGGTGLGLAIVKHIVERHRGRLEIASTVGAGTTVTVTLPAAVSRNSHETVTEVSPPMPSAAA